MLYEGGIRSPLVVWGPGLVEPSQAGTVNGTSVLSGIDLVPSLLAIAGVPTGGVRFDGEALPGTLLGRSAASREQPLFFRRPPDRDRFYGVDDLPDLAVRDGRWKLLCEYDGSKPLLYDLEADPGETRDLASERPGIVERLVAEVVVWHASLPPDAGARWRDGA